MRRLAAVWLPFWPVERQRRRDPARFPAGRPAALVAAMTGGFRLTAVDALAAAEGLAPGQLATDARALVPALVLQPGDPAADARALDDLLHWASRWSPMVARDGTDGFVLDVGGASHLFGGEKALLADIGRRLGGLGLTSRQALAGSAAAAAALARCAADHCIVAGGSAAHAAALAPLPLAALRLEPAIAAALIRLGITTIGQLAGLPRPSLDRRFGGGPTQCLDRALLRAAEAMSWVEPMPRFRTFLPFAEPLAGRAGIEAAAARLGEALSRLLGEAGQGVLKLVLQLHRVDGARPCVALSLIRPSRDPVHLQRLICPRLDGLDIGFGLDAMALVAETVAPLGAEALALGAADGAPSREALAELVDRLSNRLGREALACLEPVASHRPERAERLVSLNREDRADREDRSGARAEMLCLADRGPERPLRLLGRAQPIEVVAEIPEGPPRLFRWQGASHQVVRAEGPERLAPEWWRADATMRARDYYRVETASGGRFWLYRDGLYQRRGDGEGEAPPAWYLHGFFA